jgi:hypothetical protein
MRAGGGAGETESGREGERAEGREGMKERESVCASRMHVFSLTKKKNTSKLHLDGACEFEKRVVATCVGVEESAWEWFKGLVRTRVFETCIGVEESA